MIRAGTLQLILISDHRHPSSDIFPERCLHLAPRLHRGVVLVKNDIAPSKALAFSNVALERNAMLTVGFGRRNQ